MGKGGNLPSWARGNAAAGKTTGGSSDLPSWATSGTPPAVKPEHHGGHGFLHGLEHVAGQTVSDLYDTAVHSPSGLYQLSKAVALASAGNPKPLENIAIQTGKGFVTDFRHPLRHPGNTLLDIGAALSLGAGTAARIGEVGRALDAGEGAAAVGRGALHGPKPEARNIKYGDTSVSAGTYSRAALRRSSQKLYDQMQQRFPDGRFPLRNLHERVGYELGTDRRMSDAIGRAPAHALAKIKLSLPKQKALQIVAEGVPVRDRIRFHEAQLPALKGKLATATRKEIATLKAASQYVHDVNGMPRIRPEHHDLVDVYQKAHAVATERETLLGNTDRLARAPHEGGSHVYRTQALSDAAAENRIAMPAAVIRGELGQTHYGFGHEVVDNSHYFNQFGNHFPVKLAEDGRTQVHNVHDEHGNLVGSLVYDARPGRRNVYVESMFIRPEFRHDLSYLRKLVEPLRHEKRPIEADFQNPRLQRVVEKLTGRGEIKGKVLPSASDEKILRDTPPVEELPPLKEGAHAHGFNPDMVPELFRFPYATKKALPALGKMAGYKGGIGKTPGTLNHEFKGALLKSGAFRNDTTKLVAESYLEAHRFSALMKHRDEFLQLAHDEKQGVHDIPIRTDALLNRPWPKVLNDLSEKPALTKGDVQALGTHYEDARNDVFPTEAIVKLEESLLGEGKHPQVKWIDSRVLGGLNKPNPLVGFHGGSAQGLKVFDAINNASRAAILYLKPAYAVPNILGNAALNIVQQGWGAPSQVARSARLWAKLDKDTRAVVKQAMGEGVTGSLHTESGLAAGAINKMAELWSGPVDTPFRVNAFFYEARRFGYKTPAQLRKLLGDEKELLKVAREANAEIIDYGRLGPFEQNVVRRVIFFYPWVKGSSVYAARFVTTHPQLAALAGQLGEQGAVRDAAELGPLPSYAEGLFKVGERGGNPLVVNPSSAGVLQTPADLLRSVQELGSGHPGQAFTFGQNFTPALQAALTVLTHSGARRNESSLAAAERELVSGLPIVTTVQGVRHPPSESSRPRVYPRDARDVLLHYLVGGLAPTPLNLPKAHAAKYLEDHPR